MRASTKVSTIRRLPDLKTSLAAACAVAAWVATTGARAQSMDYGALEQLFGEPVTISATGSPQKVADAPVDMQIITADDIRRSGADNIPDILQFVAGVDVRRYSFGQAEVSVRGYDQQDSPRLLVLINGRQVYIDDYGRTAWQTLPVQLDEIRQIEIIEGPNSALYGFNAAGGVINIVTYDPLLDSTKVVTVRGGSQSDAGASAVATFHAGDDAGLRVSVGGSGASEDSTAQAPASNGAMFDAPYDRSLSASGEYKLDPDIEFAAEATASQAKNLDILPVPSYSDDTYRTDSVKLGVTAETKLGLVDVSAYRNRVRTEFQAPQGSGTIDNVIYVAQGTDLFRLGADHTIRLGIEYRDNNLTGAFLGGTIGYDVYAASAMWNWSIAPALTLTNSVRLDYLLLNFAGAVLPISRYTAAKYDNSSLAAPSFNSGVVWRPSDADTVRVTVARGVQAPSLIDFGFEVTGGRPGELVSLIGSPGLHSTSVTNYEIDYDRAIRTLGATLRTSFYYQESDDLLASALNVPLVPSATGVIGYAQNYGRSEAAGGTIGLESKDATGVRWKAAYSLESITDHPSFPIGSGGTSLLDYEHGTPHSIVTGGIGYDWARFEFDAQARWQSSFVDYAPAVYRSVVRQAISDSITLDLRIGWQVTDHLTLAVSGEQLNRNRQYLAAGLPVERRVLASATAHF